jgi:3-hydroxyacyl-CoA dehydrogenase/enoyl-CoA hydratase/3-hydroxybutyryl-CoA epimerase
MNTAISVRVTPSKVAVITIDLPGSKMNVLSGPLMSELEAAVDKLAVTPDIAGLVIVSGKPDSFFAGANIDEIVPIQTAPSVVAFDATQRGKAVFAKLEKLPFRTVAAVNGICLGGGTELTLFCSHRVASDSKKTKFGLPEVGLGFLPGWGGSVLLPRLVGAQTAMDLILKPLGTWDAKKAWRNGMVDEVVPADRLLDRAIEIAKGAEPKRAKQPLKKKLMTWALEGNGIGRKVFANMAAKAIKAETKGNYPAPPAAFKVVLASLTMPRDKAFELESQTFARLATTPESRNLVGVHLATVESKKSPNNARPHIDVKTVGVLGAGVMGAGIAQAALYAGFKVVLYDKFEAGLKKGVATIDGLFQGLVEKGKMSASEKEVIMGKLAATLTYDTLADCDVVIEAIVEDMGAKKSAIAELQKVIQKPWIFATNTSSLSVSTMAEAAATPANVGGLHFFNPVHKMLLVEVIAGEHTSDETVATLKALAGRLNKTAVLSADSNGFIVNRILAPYMYESARLMEEGVPLKDIDDAMKRFGMPMGPLALLDEVGLDIATKVLHVLHGAFGDRLKSPAIMSFIESSKLLGKKGGKGIYLYDEAGKRGEFNPDIVGAIKAAAAPKSRGEIQDRLVLAMVNEAARCIEEGVVTDPSQLDLAMIFGTGFPPFRGGVLKYADSVGARALVQKLDMLAKVAGANYEPCSYLRQLAATGGTFYR